MENLYIKYLSGIITENQFYEMQENMLNESYDTSKIRINFGKHQGKTFEEIDSEDPNYLKWLNSTQIFGNKNHKHSDWQMGFIGKSIYHHVNKSQIENDLHRKIFIAKVKKPFTAQNFMEKNLPTKEGNPNEKVIVSLDIHKREKKINFEKDDVVLLVKNRIIKRDKGYKCKKCETEYNSKNLPEDKKCVKRLWDNNLLNSNRPDKWDIKNSHKCNGDIEHIGISYKLAGFSDNHQFDVGYQAVGLEPNHLMKSTGFAITKLSGLEIHHNSNIDTTAIITDEVAKENLETLKIPGTTQQIFGYSTVQTIALANKYGVIDVDNHKSDGYIFQPRRTYDNNYEVSTSLLHTRLEDNQKSHIVSMPYKDPEFGISRKHNNIYSVKKQLLQEQRIAFDLYAALHGFSRPKQSQYMAKNSIDTKEFYNRITPYNFNFIHEIYNRPVDHQVEKELDGIDKSDPKVQDLIELSKYCSFIKEHGGPAAGVRSDAVLKNAIEEFKKGNA